MLQCPTRLFKRVGWANGLTSAKRLVNVEAVTAFRSSCRWRKLGDRMRRKELARRRELVVRQLHALADDLEELWKAATRDPAAEQRKERGWILLTGVLGVASTMASRKALAKLWPILTGEPPPGAKERMEPKEPHEPAPPPRDRVS
jgi:hypothetical protein